MFLAEKNVFMKTFIGHSTRIHLYLSVSIFIFGVIGNLLNILVLTHRSIRSNSCIFLFLVSSIANLISIIFGLTTRILSNWELDITEHYDLPCKFRAFITFSSRTIAVWLIMLATIDRWLLSSSQLHRRELSSLRSSQRGCVILTITSMSFYSHMLFCYQANLTKTPLKCYGKNSICRLGTDLIYAGFTIIFPVILMTGFGLKTISNIREVQACLKPSETSSDRSANREPLNTNHPHTQKRRKLENYLRRMLFIQVILLILLTLPQAAHKIFFSLTSNENKSSRAYDFDQFLYKFELLLPFIESALPFYIYTLAGGNVFRRALYKLFHCSK